MDKETRDLWILDAAARMLDRIDARTAGAGTDILKAKEQYPMFDPVIYRKMAYDALAQIKM